MDETRRTSFGHITDLEDVEGLHADGALDDAPQGRMAGHPRQVDAQLYRGVPDPHVLDVPRRNEDAIPQAVYPYCMPQCVVQAAPAQLRQLGQILFW